jgi:para-nitrobenzyl esterase
MNRQIQISLIVDPSMRRARGAARPLLVTALIAAIAGAPGCARRELEQPAPDPASRRIAPAGEVVGFQGRYGSHVWLGIPFAKPPTGALRWRAPQPLEPWAGRRAALAFGSPCTQFASAFGGVDSARAGTPVGSEDCLYLNIYAPRFAEAEVPAGTARLPVMLWIHGGGNSIGETGFYNGGNLAATHRVIVVTTNYRLGPFGWFRHAALRADGTTEVDRSGNFGTFDLVRALQWVRDNIAAFGGDPNNVTIFGESAGGANVFTLLLSPPARGLFHRAIVESGGLRMSTVAEAERFTDDAEPGDANSSGEALLQLLVKDGAAADRTAAKARLGAMSNAEVERYLRAKTNFEILGAYEPMPGLGMIDMPKVFRDGTVLPQEEPMQRFARTDGYNSVPVMLGTNRDENKLFMFGDPERVRRILWIFPRLRDAQRYNLSAEYSAKMWKATGADEPAAAMRAAQGPSVFVYRFDWDEEPMVLGADLSVMLGAAHAFEIPFVFGHFDLGRQANMIFTKENEPGRAALAAQMMSYWAEFAYKGAPGRGRDGGLPQWTPWDGATPASPKFLVFDTAAGGGLRPSADALTQKGVLAAVDADSRLPKQRDKCLIFRELAARSTGFTKRDYPTAGQKGCAEYPFDTYPWDE